MNVSSAARAVTGGGGCVVHVLVGVEKESIKCVAQLITDPIKLYVVVEKWGRGREEAEKP